MGSKRLTAATSIGLVGGLAVIVGTVLPWVTITSPGQSGSTVSFPSETTDLNGLLVSSWFLLLLGIPSASPPAGYGPAASRGRRSPCSDR